MRKLFILAASFALLAGSAWGQKGFHIGPVLSFGQVFSKNVALPDDSPYYVKNDNGTFWSGGIGAMYGFDEQTALQIGVQYQSKGFSLQPIDSTGFSYDRMEFTKTMISIPVLIHQRIRLGQSGKAFLNIFAGHSFDIISADSTVLPEPADADSGASFTRRERVFPKKIFPTVLLGAGLDIQSAGGSVLNLSVICGLGTGKMVRGEIKEWNSLYRDFNLTLDQDKEPDQFPSYYSDFAMRGTYIGVRLSYLFKLGGGGGGKKGGGLEDQPADPAPAPADNN